MVDRRLPTTYFVTVRVGITGVSSHAWQAGTWPAWPVSFQSHRSNYKTCFLCTKDFIPLVTQLTNN